MDIFFSFWFDGNNLWRNGAENIKFGMQTHYKYNYTLCMKYVYKNTLNMVIV